MLFKLGISIKMQLQYLKQSLQHIVKKAFVIALQFWTKRIFYKFKKYTILDQKSKFKDLVNDKKILPRPCYYDFNWKYTIRNKPKVLSFHFKK